MRVVVLGGGLMGVATAWYLAGDGHEVTVIEREIGVAEGTSFANAGLVTPSDSGPWNAPGTLGLLVKYLGREDSPLLVRPAALPGLFGWGARFLWNSRHRLHRANAEANTRLAVYNLALLQKLRRDLRLDYDASTNGTMRIFATAAGLESASRHAETLKPFGVPCEVLDAGGVLAREPALAAASGLVGGIYFPADESGDAHLFTRALAAHCTARGVTFRFGETVTGLDHDSERVALVRTDHGGVATDAVVIALGCWTPALTRMMGARLPIYPVKGYSATVAIDGWNEAPRMPVLHESLKVATTPLGNRLRIGGTAEFAGYDRVLNPTRAASILNAALRLYPTLAPYATPARVRQWTGLRPMTPDGRPLIGRLRLRNLFVNAGHGGLGWTLACGSGKLTADLVAGRTPDIDPVSFAPTR